jgi:hypothetical protein
MNVWFIMVYFWHGVAFVPIEYPTAQKCETALIQFRADYVAKSGAQKNSGQVDSAVCIKVSK